MGYIGGEAQCWSRAVTLIHRWTGVFPRVTECIYGNTGFGTSWSTVASLSGGPLALLVFRNNPDASTGNVSLRVSVDGGAVLISDSGLSVTGDNYLIGLAFSDNNIGGENGVIFARSTMLLEGLAASGTQYADYLAVKYEL